ncbi:MAG: MMPL family transporter, partial [SAR324 cluster bacterium]|nr:MMPL family transporter [SAR324 cluster bacterium]
RILKKHLTGYLSSTFEEHPRLQELLSGELTLEKFDDLMSYVESRNFFLHPEMYTWENFTTNLYEFSLENIDALSRENLDFKLYNVKDIYDLNLIYEQTQEIIRKHAVPGLKFHIAGAPVVTAIFAHMIGKDMGMLMPVAIVLIFFILLLSFRTAVGVFIPMITVIISMIWALGCMAMAHVPVTAISSMLPIVLLATGTAYGIHLLNRYYEDIHYSKDRKKVLQITVEHVGVAILMAGATTVAGFLSLVSSDLTLIQQFGIFAAVGVAGALFLSLTFSPAILTWWKIPQKTKALKRDNVHAEGHAIDKLMHAWAALVVKHPKAFIAGFVVLMIASALVMPQLKYEGGQMSNFKDDNPIKQSDVFINRKLSGTGLVNLLFRFRPEVLIDHPEAIESLTVAVQRLNSAWDAFVKATPESNYSPLNDQIHSLTELVKDPVKNQSGIKQIMEVTGHVLNEEYAVAVTPEETGTTKEKQQKELTSEEANALDELMGVSSEENTATHSGGGLDDLMGLADSTETSATVEKGPYEDLSSEQLAGLKEIHQQLGLTQETWESTASAVIQLRQHKQEESALKLQRAFNQLHDFFVADLTQTQVLHKIQKMQEFAEAMTSPSITIEGHVMQPTGFVVSPVDLVRKFYRVFYHDDDPTYERLPNVETDNIADPTLTDRGITGVLLNQALNANRDTFEGMVTPDLKEFQMSILTRDGSSAFIMDYETQIREGLKKLFPANDPYIADVRVAGYAPTITEVTNVISNSQAKSIAWSFVFVFPVTFFIFRSLVGWLFAIIPLFFTVLANFGMIYLLGWKINTGTMMVASISIGIGVDYTIHFLERFKTQLRQGDDLEHAYFNTIHSSGKAILITAVSVAVGFLVLIASAFVANIAMGALMAGTMIYSSLGAMTLLPALILVLKPRFFEMEKNQIDNKTKH